MNRIKNCHIVILIQTICIVALIVRDKAINNDTKQQSLAYACGVIAGIQYDSNQWAERDYCQETRKAAIKDGFTPVPDFGERVVERDLNQPYSEPEFFVRCSYQDPTTGRLIYKSTPSPCRKPAIDCVGKDSNDNILPYPVPCIKFLDK